MRKMGQRGGAHPPPPPPPHAPVPMSLPQYKTLTSPLFREMLGLKKEGNESH